MLLRIQVLLCDHNKVVPSWSLESRRTVSWEEKVDGFLKISGILSGFLCLDRLSPLASLLPLSLVSRRSYRRMLHHCGPLLYNHCEPVGVLHIMSRENASSSNNNAAAVIFSAELARSLSTCQVRLPPTAVGVRRIRPSSLTVQSVWRGTSIVAAAAAANNKIDTNVNRKQDDKIVYKIIDPETGVERRMTNQEKKEHRFKHREALRLAIKQDKEKKRLLREEEEKRKAAEDTDSGTSKDNQNKNLKRKSSSASADVASWLQQNSESGDHYLPFKINPSALEQELADLNGERDGVPPVVLAPCMARILIADFFQDTANVTALPPCVVNDELSTEWACQLKQAMVPAEQVRAQEDMRPMVYDLVPEAWRRRRPKSLGVIAYTTSEHSRIASKQGPHAWSLCTIRPPSAWDSDLAAVAQVLHRGTDLHIACGSKFGCDLLLYDSPRTECHAFAGLRVLSATRDSKGDFHLPLPITYDMTGYVRCLNTAGKLALLATVRKQKRPGGSELWEVAFVDLSLVKIGQTTGRKSTK